MAINHIPAEELGAGALITPESVAGALGLAQKGRVYDLDAGRFRGMARHYAHPPFDIATYRTPRGEQNQKDLDYLRPDVNRVNYGFISELVIGTVHTGAHIDALCHVTHGDRSEFFGGFSANEYVGDNGVLKCDVTKIPPILTRGVMVDIAALKGVDQLPASYSVSISDIQQALDRQGTQLRKGDAILIHTGQMRGWPQDVRTADIEAGISLETSKWLCDQSPVAIASDSSAVEVAPSGVEGSTQPVHIHCIIERGVYLIEWVYQEELSADRVYEFLFICLPVKIAGATGSMVRPVAVV
jgi:kynurenine formamidase